MLSYITRFNQAPTAVKAALNAPAAAARLAELEKEFGLSLAATVMKVAVKEIKLETLGAYCVNELDLTAAQAAKLETALRRDILAGIIDYLLGADKGPKHVIDEADETEARRFSPGDTAAFDTAVAASVDEVVRLSRINFSDDPLAAGRFRQVIKTYLRGARDRAASFEALIKASELGGVALTRDTAERAMVIASNYLAAPKPVSSKTAVFAETEAASRVLPPPTPAVDQPALRDAEYDLERVLREEGRLKPDALLEPILDAAHELMPPVPALVPAAEVKPPPPVREAVKKALTGRPLDRKTLRDIAPPTPKPINNVALSQTGKIKMDDIRFTPQILSPIDELRYLTLRNFRRLSSDPLQAIEKIREKMEALGRYDYGQKIEAIAAWHESPLNSLYLDIGRRSLREHVPITDILAEELKADPGYLKPEELEAIIALNKSLKF